MDYSHPVEAVVPGVQGRVLASLARSDAELTMRMVARVAGVSVTQAVTVLNRLVALGLVERRDTGVGSLVRLAKDNEAGALIAALGNLRVRVLERLRHEARSIKPQPSSVVVFGSFARGDADPTSDIDVLVVRGATITDGDDRWVDTVGRWSDTAHRIVGNPVNLLDVSEDELARLLRRADSVWTSIAREGITLLGRDIASFTRRVTAR